MSVEEVMRHTLEELIEPIRDFVERERRRNWIEKQELKKEYGFNDKEIRQLEGLGLKIFKFEEDARKSWYQVRQLDEILWQRAR